MPGQEHALLIISCKLLLLAERSPLGPRVFRRLANLTRSGYHLLLSASEPDQWFPTRGNVDDVLSTQGRLLQQLQDAGGDLDGIYYVPRSVFTQDRKRSAALKDILQRYSTDGANATLISSSKAFVKAAQRLGISTHALSLDESTVEALLEALEGLEGL